MRSDDRAVERQDAVDHDAVDRVSKDAAHDDVDAANASGSDDDDSDRDTGRAPVGEIRRRSAISRASTNGASRSRSRDFSIVPKCAPR